MGYTGHDVNLGVAEENHRISRTLVSAATSHQITNGFVALSPVESMATFFQTDRRFTARGPIYQAASELTYFPMAGG